MRRVVAFALAFLATSASLPRAEERTLVTVDLTDPGRPISDFVYGVSDISFVQNDSTLAFPLIRFGGNHTTRYNWRANAWNAARDWFYLNIPQDYTKSPKGEELSYTDRLILRQVPAGRHVLLTAPMLGWVAKDRAHSWGYSVRKYGRQQKVETSESGGDAGNGLLPSGKPLRTGGPTDTSVAVDPDFVGDWVKHTRRLLAGTGAGRVAYWALDNEPTLWHETHQDVRFGDRSLASPELSYDELWERTVAYASAIRQADPEARILGPVAWGWCAYFTSARDKCQPGPDRAAHGGKPLLQWYLQQVCAYQKTTGVRLIDVLDVHYYPENERASEDESPGEQARRLDAPRALHEKGYTDGSWIGEAIELLPRLQTWIKEECPGTGLAITEYRFGSAQNGISSTLANAEAMLLFGRHGVEVATYWGNLVKGGLLENAWRLFLDYDNKGSSALGGRALVASSADPRALPVYGIRTADHNLIYIFNKSDRPRSVRLSGAVASGRRFVLGRAGLTETRGAGNDLVVPALSVLLLETAS